MTFFLSVDRLTNFEVRVGNDDLCAFRGPQFSGTLLLSSPVLVRGRYVTIQLSTVEYLHFCEFRVFEASK